MKVVERDGSVRPCLKNSFLVLCSLCVMLAFWVFVSHVLVRGRFEFISILQSSIIFLGIDFLFDSFPSFRFFYVPWIRVFAFM